MRIVGKELTKKEVIKMEPEKLLRNTLFYAASLEERDTTVAKQSLEYCLEELLRRLNGQVVFIKYCAVLTKDIEKIIQEY